MRAPLVRILALLAIVVAAIACIALIDLTPLRQMAARQVERWLVSDRLAIEGLSIEPDFNLRLDTLTLRDGQGVWLVARGLRLDWHPALLLDGRLDISKFDAEGIELFRRPDSDTTRPSNARPGFQLPRLPVSIRIDRVTAPVHVREAVMGHDLIVAVAAGGALGQRSLALNLDVAFEGPAPGHLSAALRYDPGAPDFDLSLDFSESAGGTVASMAGLIGAGPISLKLTGEGPPEAWRGQAGLALSERACMQGKVEINAPGKKISFGGTAHPGCILARLAAFASDKPAEIAFTLAAHDDGGIEIERARWSSTAAEFGLAGTVNPNGLDLRYDLARADLKILALSGGIPAQGSVRAAGTVRGPFDALAVNARLTAGPGEASGLRWRGIALDFAANAVGQRQIKLVARGGIDGPAHEQLPSLDQVALRLEASLQPDDRRIDINEAILSSADQEFRLSGLLDGKAGHSDLALRARIVDLGNLPGGSGLSGSANLTGRVSGDLVGRRVTARIQGEARSFATGNAELDRLLGGQVRAEGTARLNGNRLVLEDMRIEGGQAGLTLRGSVMPAALEWRLNIASLEGIGLAGEATAEGRLDGAVARPMIPFRLAIDADRLQGNAEALLDMSAKVPTLKISRLDFRFAGQPVSLAAPSRIEFSPGFRLSPTEFRVGGGSLSLSGMIDRQRRISAQVDMRALPLSMLELAAPELRLQGQIDGQVVLGGSVDQPEATFAVNAIHLGADVAPAGLDATLSLDGTWHGNFLRIGATATAQGGISARGTAQLPLALSGVPAGAELRASLSMQGDASGLVELIPELASQRVEGRLSLDAALRGPLADPIVSGRLDLWNGLVESYETGTLLRDLVLHVQLAPNGGIAVDGGATDGGQGRVAVTGTGRWRDQPRLDVHVSFREFQAVRLDAASAKVQGELTAVGSPERIGVTGQVKVDAAQIELSEFLAPRIVHLDVTEIGRPSNSGSLLRPVSKIPEGASSQAGRQAELGVSVDIVRATIRGKGLDSDWKGSLSVRGSVSQPKIDGTMNVMRGTYSLLGKQFTLAEDGKIVFEGRVPPDPRLQVAALVRTDEFTAKVSVTGLASAPSLDLSSEPQVPKDEILARILFGRRMGSLSVAQQLQIAQAAAGMAFGGAGGGFDPVGMVRDFLGFDTLSVGGDPSRPGGQFVGSSGLATPTGAAAAGAPSSNGSGLAPNVSAGKYLDPNTYLQVGRGEEGSTVSVERQLGGGFSVETEVGARTGGGVSLRWTKDY